jgi:hydroxymethylglutaryl-CoA reductase (NADPH)
MEGPMVSSAQHTSGRVRVPRDPRDDATDAAQARREFLRQRTGADLHHVGRHSFDPSVQPGNIENFTGVAQVPIGGMRLLSESGGVRAAVVDEHMRRSPVFVLDHALRAREFGRWVASHDRLGRSR